MNWNINAYFMPELKIAMKKTLFFTLLFLSAFLLVPTQIIAVSRGITVVSKKGQTLGSL